MNMKVRFDSHKETAPGRDDGLQVRYAPAKRQAFRLRWYLIMLLVAAPLIFFAFRMIHGLLIVEVPAQLLFSTSELRSREAAQVTRVLVSEGDPVEKGQVVLEMDNPEWRMRLEQLSALSVELSETAHVADRGLLDVLRTQLARAERQLSLTQRLVGQGAATRGELMAAAAERDQRLASLLELEQQNVRQRQQSETSRALALQKAEEKWLRGRLDSLKTYAVAPATVSEILVQEGENVGAGTLLMRLRGAGRANIYAYIDLRDARYAQAGQALCLKLPNGEVIGGRIARDPDIAQSLPSDIRAAFRPQKRDLLVTIATDEPLPTRWLIDRLPLQVRFHCKWPFTLLW